MPEPAETASKPEAAPKTFTPTVLAWLGALGAAVAPTVQFINGYWQNQLKQTELTHQIALDFAKLAIADKATREYRRDTLKVISSIDGNPLQAWARAELEARASEQKAVIDALSRRIQDPQYASLRECKDDLERQLLVQRFRVAEAFDRKDMKDTVDVAVKDDYSRTVERKCRDMEVALTAPVATASASTASPVPVAAARPAPPPALPDRVCASGQGNPLEKLTVDKLARIYPHAQPADLQTYLPLLRKGMARAEINTCSRAAMFLAQLGHESGELRYTQELSSGDAYEGRVDLGNTQAGDGPLFKGRGLLFIVGRTNYQAFSTAIGRPDVMTTPGLVSSDPELALETALWFWTTRKLNANSDTEDIRMVTRRISGGFNGLEQRSAFFAAAKAVL